MIKMKPLLKESTWTNRKFGESLPTLEDYMSETYDDENCGDGHAVVSEVDVDDEEAIKYKDKEGRYKGVMAQEVPWASFFDNNGYLMVDYSKLDVDFVKI